MSTLLCTAGRVNSMPFQPEFAFEAHLLAHAFLARPNV